MFSLEKRNYVIKTVAKLVKSDNSTISNTKKLLLRCIHHFKSDLINNVDCFRISGIKPSSVTLSQTKQFETFKSEAPKVYKKLKPKRRV